MTKTEQEALDKIEGYKKYMVYASEQIYYAKVVKARSEEEAIDLVRDGVIEISFDDVTEGDYFEVSDAREITDRSE